MPSFWDRSAKKQEKFITQMPNLHLPSQSLRQEFNNNKRGASNYPELTLCEFTPFCAMVTADTNLEREAGGTPICSIKKKKKSQRAISDVIHPYSFNPWGMSMVHLMVYLEQGT